MADLGGTAPYCRMAPSPSRTPGPNTTSPPTGSMWKQRLVSSSAAKLSTGCHPVVSSITVTDSECPTMAAPAGVGGVNRCPGVPSEMPMLSSRMTRALTTRADASMVDAAIEVMRGESR